MSIQITSKRRALYRLLIAVSCTCAAALACLAIALRALWAGQELGAASIETLRSDPELRDRVVRKLVEDASGIYDTFPDSDVGRLLQPGLASRNIDGYQMSTNAFGLRERDYALPKPSDTVRVVILGDSFVMGSGVESWQRCGVHLERSLIEEHGSSGAKVECLHIGVNSWNILAECAYLKRQLGLLQPDLVIQVVVPNDLEDCLGTRGFGTMSRFSTQQPQRGTSICFGPGRKKLFGNRAQLLLAQAIDFEGQTRYEQCAKDMRELAALVEQQGGRYLLFSYWIFHQKVAKEYFERVLDSERVAYMPSTAYLDKSISLSDGHWNPEGHQLVARALLALIRRRHLLPRLNLRAWSAADEPHLALCAAGREEADGKTPELPPSRLPPLTSSIDFAKLKENDGLAASQIHGGIDPGGRVGPFASIVLPRGRGKRLEVEASSLGRPELVGTRIQVAVDGVAVGSMGIDHRPTWNASFELPQESLETDHVNVRFESDEFAYSHPGPDVSCVVFRLRRVSILD